MPRKPKIEPKLVSGELLPAKKPKPRAKANAKYELSLDRKLIVTPELIEDVQKHYSGGATLRQIAYALGIHPDALAKEIRTNPDLSRALHKSRLEKVSKLAGKAYEMAMAGDRVMIMFLLKTVGRFSETWKANEDGEDVPTPPLLSLPTNVDPIEAMKAYERLMKDT